MKLKIKQNNKAPYGTWFCKYCIEHPIFETRRELQKHNKEIHPEHAIKFGEKNIPPWNKGLTKENCQKIKDIAEKVSKILTGKPGHKLSEETKKKLSEIRKQKIKENNGIWWSSRSKCKRSYAEEWTKTVLLNEIKDNTFVEEYHIGRWFLDFAWPNKMIYIEIDGVQHEWAERKKMDEEKDNYCRDIGWKCLRLKWKDICNNTQETIEVIKEFVLNNKILEHEFKNITKKEQRRLNSQKRKEDQKNLWKERKELILNAGIDLLKYGWIEKVIKKTCLTKRMIELTIKKFPEDFDKKVFKRGFIK